MKHVHFIGIHGSAISGVACLAKAMGYTVSGCNLTVESDYKAQLTNAGIIAEIGHNKEHLKGVDIVVVAAVWQNKNLPEEVQMALDAGILMKWQNFLGKYIFPKYKNVIGVCGTHGKTTTTSLLAITLQNLGMDPTAVVGGIVSAWNSSTKLGKSDWLVCEADEYDYNFIGYNPKIVIFNNLEMEHPERFNNYEEYIQTFHDFFLTIQNDGILICNADDKNSMDLIKSIYNKLKEKSIKIIGYTTAKEDNLILNKNIIDKIYRYDVKDVSGKFTTQNQDYELSILGRHNISNAMGVVALCNELKIDPKKIKEAIKTFGGTKKRLEKVYDDKGIRLFNDYAHHHTQVKVCLETLRESYPDQKLIAVFEPHQISRLTQNSEEYLSALDIADDSFITKIYVEREKGKALPDIANLIKSHPKIKYIEDFEELAKKVFSLSKGKPCNIIVMGAGYSYQIVEKIKNMLLKDTM